MKILRMYSRVFTLRESIKIIVYTSEYRIKIICNPNAVCLLHHIYFRVYVQTHKSFTLLGWLNLNLSLMNPFIGLICKNIPFNLNSKISRSVWNLIYLRNIVKVVASLEPFSWWGLMNERWCLVKSSSFYSSSVYWTFFYLFSYSARFIFHIFLQFKVC